MPRLSNRFPTWAANQTWAVQSFHNYFFEIADEISCENHQQEINTKKICSWGALTEGLEQSPSGVAELRMDVPTLTAEKEEHTTAKTQRKPAGEVWSKTHTASLIFSAKGGKKKKLRNATSFFLPSNAKPTGVPKSKAFCLKALLLPVPNLISRAAAQIKPYRMLCVRLESPQKNSTQENASQGL